MCAKRGLVTCLLVVTSITGGFIKEAAGRGFCNVDHLGSDALQAQIAEAGANFYNAGSALWQMLAAIESGEDEAAQSVGSEAQEAFSTASAGYDKATELVDDELSGIIRTVDLSAAAALSRVSLEFEEINELSSFAQQGNTAELFSFCSEQSEAMASATEVFIRYIAETEPEERQEKPFVTLVLAWNETLFYGRFISAMFAVAGGEKP